MATMPAHLDVRMRAWERTLGPQFQQLRVLQWTPEAQRLWDARGTRGPRGPPHRTQTTNSVLCGAPKWALVVIGACVLLLAVLLVLGGCKWLSRKGGRHVVALP